MSAVYDSRNSPHRFIVFTGPSQSGKTTAANIMAEYMRLLTTVRRDSFEMPTKHYLTQLLSRKFKAMPIDEVIPSLGKAPRDFIRMTHQHMRFSFGPDVLGRLLRDRAMQFKERYEHIIVDDGTSLSDVKALGEYTLIRIDRENSERIYPFTIPNPHYVLPNRGTLTGLEIGVRNIVKNILDTCNANT